MEEIARRPGHARNNRNTRRTRRSGIANRNRDKISVLNSIILCTAIFCILWAAKSINTPISKRFTDYVKGVLEADITLDGIYSTIDSIINTWTNSKIKGGKINGDAISPVGQHSENNGYSKDDNATLTLSAGSIDRGTPAPLKGRIISEYGERLDPIDNTKKEFHCGIDIEPIGETEVIAVMDGEVEDIGNSKNYGKYVSIRNENGYVCIYAHCSSVYVSKGASIKQGDVIADVKNIVLGIGSHLHFEIWKDGKHINPEEIIMS